MVAQGRDFQVHKSLLLAVGAAVGGVVDACFIRGRQRGHASARARGARLRGTAGLDGFLQRGTHLAVFLVQRLHRASRLGGTVQRVGSRPGGTGLDGLVRGMQGHGVKRVQPLRQLPGHVLAGGGDLHPGRAAEHTYQFRAAEIPAQTRFTPVQGHANQFCGWVAAAMDTPIRVTSRPQRADASAGRGQGDIRTDPKPVPPRQTFLNAVGANNCA